MDKANKGKLSPSMTCKCGAKSMPCFQKNIIFYEPLDNYICNKCYDKERASYLELKKSSISCKLSSPNLSLFEYS